MCEKIKRNRINIISYDLIKTLFVYVTSSTKLTPSPGPLLRAVGVPVYLLLGYVPAWAGHGCKYFVRHEGRNELETRRPSKRGR